MSLNLSCGGAQADTTTFKAEKRMKIYFLFNQVKQIQMMLNSLRPGVNDTYTWKSYPATKTFEDASPNQGPVGKRRYWTCLLGRYDIFKGRVTLPKRVNFRKSSMGRRSFSIQKLLQILDLFSENEGGGQRPFGNFS